MEPSYISMKDELEGERQFYSEELKKSDWEYLKEASELFLIHAYSHRFETSPEGRAVLGDAFSSTQYSQFHLNLAVGLELLLKSILLRKGIKINRPLKRGTNDDFDPEHTISFMDMIEKYLNKIFPELEEHTCEDIKATLELINLKRNNIAHSSKRSYDHYAYEYRFSYITLYIYEEFFYEENSGLTGLLLKSINGSKITGDGNDFKPLIIIPKSLRK